MTKKQLLLIALLLLGLLTACDADPQQNVTNVSPIPARTINSDFEQGKFVSLENQSTPPGAMLPLDQNYSSPIDISFEVIIFREEVNISVNEEPRCNVKLINSEARIITIDSDSDIQVVCGYDDEFNLVQITVHGYWNTQVEEFHSNKLILQIDILESRTLFVDQVGSGLNEMQIDFVVVSPNEEIIVLINDIEECIIRLDSGEGHYSHQISSDYQTNYCYYDADNQQFLLKLFTATDQIRVHQ